MQGLFSGNIISSESLNILLDSHIIMENAATRWHGYGWFIDTSSGKRVFEYSGALVGYASKVMHIVDENITIIVLTNREDYDQLSAICSTLPILLHAQR
jgi:hypothetical protein